jgi:hypothetical protein
MSSNLASGGTNGPDGAFFQPQPGVAITGVEPYRDSQATAQVGGSVSAPGAGATIATVTPGVAGLYEITGTVAISGTTAAAADANNMRLRQNSTSLLANIPIGLATTGNLGAVPFGPVLAQLAAADTVNVVAVGAATAGSVYGAQINCRLVG